jgi:glycosyltransferase involved in cell wall biosynthesis
MMNHLRRYRSWHRAGDFALHLAERGHDVTLLVISDNNRWRFSESNYNGIRIVECPDLLIGNARSGWDPVCALRRVLWLARDGRRYDVVHLFETRPATIIPGLWFARSTRTPLIIDWNDWWGRGGILSIRRPWWYKLAFSAIETFFEEYFRRFAHATTVISKGLFRRAILLGIDRDTITHIHPGIDSRRFSDDGRERVRKKLGYADTDFVIAYSSQDTFFDMAPVFEGLQIAHDRAQQIKMLLIGKYSRAVSKAIKRHRLESIACCAGFVADSDYPQYLAAADAFVVPFPETVYNIGRWPNKFGDYLAAGRPIVFNGSGDLADFAHNAPGIACSFSAASFAQAFCRLAANKNERDRHIRRARQLIRSYFNWDAQIDRLEAAYARARVTMRRKARSGGLHARQNTEANYSFYLRFHSEKAPHV